jgi:choline/glycine/proline betaine transport protein
MFGGYRSRETEVYYRVEFSPRRAPRVRPDGVTRQKITDDVLDRCEARLGPLTHSTQHVYASVVTPPVPRATGSIPGEACSRVRQRGRGSQGVMWPMALQPVALSC